MVHRDYPHPRHMGCIADDGVDLPERKAEGDLATIKTALEQGHVHDRSPPPVSRHRSRKNGRSHRFCRRRRSPVGMAVRFAVVTVLATRSRAPRFSYGRLFRCGAGGSARNRGPSSRSCYGRRQDSGRRTGCRGPRARYHGRGGRIGVGTAGVPGDMATSWVPVGQG